MHLYGRATRKQFRKEFKSYIGFLHRADELNDSERDVFLKYERWLLEVESTDMNKCYKMVVLMYMLERGVDSWLDPITSIDVAAYFHRYLTEKEYRKQKDFSGSGAKKLWKYNEKKVASLIARMPMTMWAGSSSGMVNYVDGVFGIHIELEDHGSEQRESLHQWTQEISLFRLHYHFERRGDKEEHN